MTSVATVTIAITGPACVWRGECVHKQGSRDPTLPGMMARQPSDSNTFWNALDKRSITTASLGPGPVTSRTFYCPILVALSRYEPDEGLTLRHPHTLPKILQAAVFADSYPSMLQLKVWEVKGDQKYIQLLPMYCRNTNATLVVFDTTDRKSFEEVLPLFLTKISGCAEEALSFSLVTMTG